MNFEIESYVSVGPIRFGMSREEVRLAVVAERLEVMHRSTEKPGDYFPTWGLFVDYRPQAVCEFVECAGPLILTFQGQAFLGQPYRKARIWFAARDPKLETDGAGLISRRFGIALYARSAEKDPDEPVESIAAFERGYYDLAVEERQRLMQEMIK